MKPNRLGWIALGLVCAPSCAHDAARAFRCEL